MMTKKEKKRVPELRFVGFEGEWEKKELRKVASINPKNGELPDSFIYVDLESVNNGILDKEERVLKKDAPSRAQRLLERNDILYQTVRPYQKNNLFFDKEDKDYVASTGYAQIRTDNNSRYLYQYIHTALFVNKVLLRCTGTSYPAINSTDLSKIKVSIPSKEEQQKIASFLTSIDTRIQQLEKKRTLLEEYKKGVMQKIFSQEIRFKPALSGVEVDDDGKEFGKWEEKRLGELGEIITGKTPSTSNPDLWSGDIHFVTPTDIDGNKYQYKTQRTVARTSKMKVLPLKSILFTCIASIGKMSLSTKPCITNQQINSIVPYEEFDNEFVYYSLLNMVEYIKSTQSTNTLPIINKTEFSKFKINVPKDLEEQTKIAHFLSAIDRKIAVMDGQIEKTKEWKKGLLQRMFV